MTDCPTCKFSMESHSKIELIECCMRQSKENIQEPRGICLNCKDKISSHSDARLAECAITFLKSEKPA